MLNYVENISPKDRDSFSVKSFFQENGIRNEIAASWERCEEQKLPRDLTSVKMPRESNNFHKPSKAYLGLLEQVTSCFYQTLVENDEAVFYAYDNGIIFSQNGSQEVLGHFNSLNIGIGTCIFEEYLGSTGAAFIKEINDEAWVVGKEHYLNILTPYITYSSFVEDLWIYTFIILPKENFNLRFLNGTTVFHKAMKVALNSYRKDLEVRMKVKLFDELLENKNQAILFIDIVGKVITANTTFCNWFQLPLDEIKNVDCITLFPELKMALTCFQTEEKKVFERVFLEKAPGHKQHMQMDVAPVIHSQEVSGLVIRFTDTGTFSTKISKGFNSQANHTFDHILGNSYDLRKVKSEAIAVAHSNSAVVITGESGTGKELFAQSIHNESLRRDKPFVALNCACIPKELMASELFGYVEGAFTGAKKGGSIGKFEFANGGTIFLDEIGELALSVQALLLRVLEEKTITKIGSNVSTPINIRLICATNRNLKQMVKEGSFRLDLFYRINVMHLHLPPLREQVIDIPMFADYFIKYFNDVLGKQVERISQEALSALVRYDWPGNLREFRNIMECAMNNVDGSTLEAEDFPSDIFCSSIDIKKEGAGGSFLQENDFCSEERKRILSLMIEYNGNKSQVAEELGIARSTLYKKIKDYKLV